MGYEIAADGTTITCHQCGRKSYHPDDIAARYCGYCHVFHDDECHPCERCGILLVRVLVPGVRDPRKLPRFCHHCEDAA